MENICTMIKIKGNMYILFYFLLIFSSCEIFDSNENLKIEKVFIAKQGDDQIAIFNLLDNSIDTILIDYPEIDCLELENEQCQNAGCMWHIMGEDYMCMSMSTPQSTNGPHFVTLDNLNRYLFVTSISSGWVGRYNLDSYEFIDKIMVGSMPALMVLNQTDSKLYVSRMMSMTINPNDIHLQDRTDIQVINYSDNDKMYLENTIEIGSPSPHAVSINTTGSEIFVSTYEGNWLFKINAFSNMVIAEQPLESFTLDKSEKNARLKPVQSVLVQDSLLFISCEGGVWGSGSSTESIPGQIQMWNTNSMTLIDTYKFNVINRPWHIIASPINNQIYIVLKGPVNTGLHPDEDGVACLSFSSKGMDKKWHITNSSFAYLHGITISNDGSTLFVTGETDANLYEIKAIDGQVLNIIPIGLEGISKLQGVTYYSN